VTFSSTPWNWFQHPRLRNPALETSKRHPWTSPHLFLIHKQIHLCSARFCKYHTPTTQSHHKEGILPSLHYTVIEFALDWESHKSLKHDREYLTELLERACFQPRAIQWIQLAEVGWESDKKGFERKRGWVVCIKSCANFSVLVCC